MTTVEMSKYYSNRRGITHEKIGQLRGINYATIKKS